MVVSEKSTYFFFSIKKLEKKHGVTRREVEQCFENKQYCSLMDTREPHHTDPPTQWFLASTNQVRRLKIVYIQYGSKVYLKTAYEANAQEVSIYTTLCGPI